MDRRSELTADAEPLWARPGVLLPTFALIALVGGALPSFSTRANLLVLGVGGVMFWLGISGTVARRPAPERLSRRASWWLVPVLLLAFVELYTFSIGQSYGHPTLSKLADPVLERYLARAALYFGWLVAFWGLVRR
jgi:hypothetical protein